jgi:hypothetical protein
LAALAAGPKRQVTTGGDRDRWMWIQWKKVIERRWKIKHLVWRKSVKKVIFPSIGQWNLNLILKLKFADVIVALWVELRCLDWNLECPTCGVCVLIQFCYAVCSARRVIKYVWSVFGIPARFAHWPSDPKRISEFTGMTAWLVPPIGFQTHHVFTISLSKKNTVVEKSEPIMFRAATSRSRTPTDA